MEGEAPVVFYLYRITNLVNLCMYFGVTKEPKARWAFHRQVAKNGKEKHSYHFQPIHSAIKKYGIENFSFDLIRQAPTDNECYGFEIAIISLMRELKVKIYNVAGGGRGTGSGAGHPMYGKKLTAEWKAKIGIASSRTQNDPITKQKNRQRMIDRNWIGDKHPFFGKHHTYAAKEKISKKGIGRKFTEDHKAKISKAHKGKIVSQQTREKQSITRKAMDTSGSKNSNYNNKWSSEQKRALSDKKKGKPLLMLRALTEAQAHGILNLRATTELTRREIADKYNVTVSTIKSVIGGRGAYKEYKSTFIKNLNPNE